MGTVIYDRIKSRIPALASFNMTLIGIWRAFEPQTQRVRVIRRMGRRFASLTKGHHEQERMG